MGDEGVSANFHKFLLEETLQPCVGVDFRKFNFDLKELIGLTCLLIGMT